MDKTLPSSNCAVVIASSDSAKWEKAIPKDELGARPVTRIRFGSNTIFSVGALTPPTADGSTDPALDLLELASAVYLSDQLVKRSAKVNAARRISLHLGVRRPKVCNAAKPLIERTLLFLTRDVWSITFHPREAKSGSPAVSKFDGQFSAPQGVDCVALFSGGLDSFAGALTLYKQGKTPVLLSHSGHWKSRQQRLHQRIEPLTKQSLAQFNLGPRAGNVSESDRLERKETSQRARAFLYLGAAGALAHSLGINDIYLCENGPLACAVPPMPHFIPTRHAHPHFLGLMVEVMNALLGGQLTISNPFLFSTKGEAVAGVADLIRANNLKPCIAETVSCWQYFARLLNLKPPNVSCGACIPCLVRRAALKAAGLEKADAEPWVLLEQSPGSLKLNVRKSTTSEAAEERLRQSWLAYQRFARQMTESTEAQFFQLTGAGDLSRSPGLRELSDDWHSSTFKLYQRFAAEYRRRFPFPKDFLLN